jgi:bifunctional non-homologous end joining protein LigD
MVADPLATYNSKRDFAKTAEPQGALASGKGNRFMVQKHDATRLHWDLRLEVGGVMKSWAVTRGPSLNPDDKRLAVQTEDHPLSYADFEGIIPSKEYGGGTVMLWDDGSWAPVPGKSAKDLEKGHLHFVLNGEHMKGEWLLIRLKPRGKERNTNWLLRKVADGFAGGSDDLVEGALTSVKTGRTMEQIASGKAAKKLAGWKTQHRRPPRVPRRARCRHSSRRNSARWWIACRPVRAGSTRSNMTGIARWSRWRAARPKCSRAAGSTGPTSFPVSPRPRQDYRSDLR